MMCLTQFPELVNLSLDKQNEKEEQKTPIAFAHIRSNWKKEL